MILTLSKIALVVVVATPLTTLAQEFVPLVGIPFVDTNSVDSLGDYANAFYIAAISLGAVIAVLKIIFAGVKYMLSDVITDKSAAKADIKGALLGLILIIGAVLLLNTISPNITSLQAFNLTALQITRPPAPDPTITTSPAGVLTIDGAATAAQERAFAEQCVRDTNNDGFPDGQVVRFGNRTECQAMANENAVVNTDQQFDRLLAASPNWAADIVGKTAAEISVMRQEELEMYREFISNFEATEGTYNLAAIAEEVGATEVLFVVKDPLNTPGLDPTGVMDQYNARCTYFTNSDNLVQVNGVYACVQ